MSQPADPTQRIDLTPMFHARSLAIVGISHPGRFGGILYDNLQQMGYAGAIYGVNPRYDTLYDQPCYPSLKDLPETPDLALLAVPNQRLVAALEEVAECGIPAAAMFANAHSDPEDGEPSLQDQLKQIAVESNIALLGPNCMGFVAPGQKLPISGYVVNPRTTAGRVTLISHSGSVWEGFAQNNRRVAFNYIVSTGNELAITVADVMQFALADPSTQVIGLFLETVRDPKTFMSALKDAAERDIPIVVVKTGSSERGAQLAQAHTGALTGEDGAYDALFKRYGVSRARSLDEMIDTLELFSTGVRPRTQYLSAILDSGGQRALMVDLAEREGVEFAQINPQTEAKLTKVLEPGLSATNPLDAWGTGNDSDDIYSDCLLALDQDPMTGLTLVAADMPPNEDPWSSYPNLLLSLQEKLENPVALLGHLAAAQSQPQMDMLRDAGIAVLMGTETGLRASGHLLRYSAFQRALKEVGWDVGTQIEAPNRLASLRRQLGEATEPLGEYASKQVMHAYGLTITRETLACTRGDVLRAGEEIGYPVALKTCSDLHKTERGGVALGLQDADALAATYLDFETRLGPDVLVQQMAPSGTELILGIVNDPQFGPMLTLGAGGIFVEVLQDVTMLTLPTSPDTVREALLSLRVAKLLGGARGKPPANIEAVVQAAMGLAALARDLGNDIAEVDINPLICGPDQAYVVDALIIPKN